MAFCLPYLVPENVQRRRKSIAARDKILHDSCTRFFAARHFEFYEGLGKEVATRSNLLLVCIYCRPCALCYVKTILLLLFRTLFGHYDQGEVKKQCLERWKVKLVPNVIQFKSILQADRPVHMTISLWFFTATQFISVLAPTQNDRTLLEGAKMEKKK